jgi:hypothetical protein
VGIGRPGNSVRRVADEVRLEDELANVGDWERETAVVDRRFGVRRVGGGKTGGLSANVKEMLIIAALEAFIIGTVRQVVT